MPELYRTRGLALLLDEALELSKRPPYRTPFLVGTVIGVVTVLYSALIAALSTGSGLALSMVGLGSMLLLIPIMLVVQGLGYGALAISATRNAHGLDARPYEALKTLFSPKVLGTLLLVAVIGFLATLMLVLPGLLFAVLMAFVFQVMVREGRYGIDAVQRSATLVWRNPRGTLRSAPLVGVVCIFLVFFMLNAGLTIALQLPMQVLVQYATFREAISGDVLETGAYGVLLWLQVPVSLVSTYVTVFTAWYFWHCLAMYHREVLEVREAPSIEAAIDSWSTVPQPPPPSAPGPPP